MRVLYIYIYIHFVWSLLFLKGYNTEIYNSTLVSTTPKAYRMWVWILIESLSQIPCCMFYQPLLSYVKLYGLTRVLLYHFFWIFNWEHRTRGACLEGALVSVSRTDVSILERTPLHTKWFPHKLNMCGLRYEIGSCISTGV